MTDAERIEKRIECLEAELALRLEILAKLRPLVPMAIKILRRNLTRRNLKCGINAIQVDTALTVLALLR